jgi:hypothetical protein
MVELLLKNPALVTFLWATVLWPVGSGIVNLIFDRFIPNTDAGWDLWFASNPGRAALAKLLRQWGVNLPGGFRTIRAFFSGPAPKFPAKTEEPVKDPPKPV